ncbi:MAG: hypothetical protein L0219_17780 [Phycisphaerales bacterium]|nr:hypothetical protein [Phycisphaerales bacterium]
MDIALALIAVVLFAASGCPGLCFGRRVVTGQWIATALMLIGCTLSAFACIRVFLFEQRSEFDVGWFLPWGRFAVGLDALSAVFLLPVCIVPTLGSLYGMSYWSQAEHPENGRKLRVFYGLLTASMGMVVLAQDAIVFLLAWEIMAISAFFLITTEDGNLAARQAGWIYLVAAHLGTLCLLPMFALLAHGSGSFAMEPLNGGGNEMSTAVFVLAVVGFGLKAGVIPLHVWLPGAHANAPSHVSAVLSGVMLKMGIYGLVRIISLFSAPPAWWGGALLCIGSVTGLIGIVYAIGQHDLKRLLAYSSIENIGIIVIGVGLATLGRSLSQPEWIALGLGGALLHVWNHSLFKPLLFFASGAVMHSAHTRQIDRLGGLAHRMPRTALLFSFGAIAICGLPPLNGFVGELLIYLGLFKTLGMQGGVEWPWAAFVPPILAIIGGLTILCLVKAYAGVFLGSPRTPDSATAHEASRSMRGAMIALALGCLLIGLAPRFVLGPLQQTVRAWVGNDLVASANLVKIIPSTWISAIGISLAAVAAASVAAYKRGVSARTTGTWDCGYAAPTPRIQYTSASLGQILVGLFRWALWPKRHLPRIVGRFPQGSQFKSHVPDVVLDRGVLPSFRIAATFLPWVRLLQQGKVQVYVLYILAILIVLLLWG